MSDDQRRKTIRRIAETLGISENEFYECPNDQTPSSRSDAAEVLELIKLFSAITDSRVRLNCLAYVRNCADDVLELANAPSNDSGRGI